MSSACGGGWSVVTPIRHSHARVTCACVQSKAGYAVLAHNSGVILMADWWYLVHEAVTANEEAIAASSNAENRAVCCRAAHALQGAAMELHAVSC